MRFMSVLIPRPSRTRRKRVERTVLDFAWIVHSAIARQRHVDHHGAEQDVIT